jgi:TolA-binding protein
MKPLDTMRLLTLLAATSLLAPFATGQKINDAIVKKDGARVRGLEITEFLLSGVRAKRGSDNVEVPAHQVLGIEWSNLPEAFVVGRSAMQRGDFANAAQMFGEAANKADRPLVKADAEFFLIKCAVASIGADRNAAATAAARAKAWLEANPNHWRTPEALLLAGRAERLAGTGAAAAATLRELDDRAMREAFGAVWSARAKSELAMTLLADGKASEARTTFQSAAGAADSALATAGPDEAELRRLRLLARVGEGETYLTEKQFQRAEQFFHALATGTDAELVASGYAGEGEAIFMAAVADNKPGDLRRAQLALAKACVLDVQSGEASAKANYYLGRCTLELGPEREGDSFKARAASYFQIVASNYPESRWAADAKIEQAR